MIEKIQRKFALSKQGATDLIGACICCAVSNIALMMPVGIIYFLIKDIMGGTLGSNIGFYAAATAVCLLPKSSGGYRFRFSVKRIWRI